MIDLWLVVLLGFVGSFGHCVGMCGPLTAAFSLSQQFSTWQQRLYFNGLLNLGRILSYALVGAGIGALGSVLVAGGQLAGIDSALRQGLSIATGLLLIWMGLNQINPKLLPHIPLLHPILQGKFHERLSAGMMQVSSNAHWWTPALLGLTWGLIPCGFLYTAQVKAAETGSLWQGTATMLAFGLGTVPSMLGIGISTTFLSRDRRSQLFRLGGWVTLAIGILTLFRTDAMVDYTGHAAIISLMLALIARPISRVWSVLLRYRRAFGVGAYVLSLAHTGHMLDHTFEWDLQGLPFLPIEQQVGMGAGVIAIGLMTPAALTSFDWMVNRLGKYWRHIHLLSVPALILGVSHTLLMGSHYLGATDWTTANTVLSGVLIAATLSVLLLRLSWFWSLPFLKPFYAPPHRAKE